MRLGRGRSPSTQLASEPVREQVRRVRQLVRQPIRTGKSWPTRVGQQVRGPASKVEFGLKSCIRTVLNIA
jgi:hypothetical protein